MPTYFATYGTFRLAAARLETPELRVARHVGSCTISGRLYQMGGYPVLKAGGGRVKGDLLELPWHFDFGVLDKYEDYHPTKPWACRYLRRRIRLLEPRVEAWVYVYAWPADAATFMPSGDWLKVLEAGLRHRRFRGDRRPMSHYRPPGWPDHPRRK
jgi:gamma-glutamylcyclotransferase (GGCT)/AIG2-like uncharacterized protein YtfP